MQTSKEVKEVKEVQKNEDKLNAETELNKED